VYVHSAGEPDDNHALVFHYVPDNDGPFPVIAPRVFWSDASSLHIALSSNPAAPSLKVLVRLKRLGGVQIVYDRGPDEPKETLVPKAMHPPNTYVLSVPFWSRLHSGMKVYFGGDPVNGEGLTVCPSVEAYNHVRIDNHWPFEDATIGTSRCIHAKYGTLATITAIIPSSIHDVYYPAPLVRVQRHGGWMGITTVLGLQPDVPVGSIVTMTRKEFVATLDSCQERICAHHHSISDRVEIRGSVRVHVLRYDPSGRAFDNLYVQVLNGRYAGRRGWMDTYYMRSTDSLYSNGYGLDYAPLPELVPNAT
jgi:hypothetical protein